MRIAIGIEYDGTAYNGWQRQRNGIGVQALVEKALGAVADATIEVTCAGRTDSGVHASAQVAHFDTTAQRSNRGWLLGANTHLPDDINVSWVREVDADFHARFSAVSRSYQYLILNRLVRSALHRNRAWWVHSALDETAMHAAAQTLLGEHDFSAFRASGCQAATPRRDLTSIAVRRNGNWLALDISANAFLQHMVRNIMGTLVAIGSGEQPISWAADVLASGDRKSGGIAAPPHGLTLVRVDYPESFEIPMALSAETPFASGNNDSKHLT